MGAYLFFDAPNCDVWLAPQPYTGAYQWWPSLPTVAQPIRWNVCAFDQQFPGYVSPPAHCNCGSQQPPQPPNPQPQPPGTPPTQNPQPPSQGEDIPPTESPVTGDPPSPPPEGCGPAMITVPPEDDRTTSSSFWRSGKGGDQADGNSPLDTLAQPMVGALTPLPIYSGTQPGSKPTYTNQPYFEISEGQGQISTNVFHEGTGDGLFVIHNPEFTDYHLYGAAVVDNMGWPTNISETTLLLHNSTRADGSTGDNAVTNLFFGVPLRTTPGYSSGWRLHFDLATGNMELDHYDANGSYDGLGDLLINGVSASAGGGGAHPDPHLLSNGSALAPTYSFSSNGGTGMWLDTSASPNALSFNSPDGTTMFTVDAAGVSVAGKLTVSGLIDPTGLVLSEQASSPHSTAAGEGTIFVVSDSPNRPKFEDDAGTEHYLAYLSETVTGGAAAPAHNTSHQNGGGDEINVDGLSGELADAQPVAVAKNSALVGTRSQINFIEGSNVTLTVTDDGVDDEVEVTIAASGGGGSFDLCDETLTTDHDPASDHFLISDCGSTGARKILVEDVVPIVNVCNFRLTGVTALPYGSASDIATLYFSPIDGISSGNNGQITMWDGSIYKVMESGEISKAVTGLTSGKPYDVFVYDNAGTLTMEFLVWTDDSTRATTLDYDPKIGHFKNGDLTRKYVGSFYTTATNRTQDTQQERYLWNKYNKIEKVLDKVESTNTWTYSSSAFRQANASTSNEVRVMVGIDEDSVKINVNATYGHSGTAVVAATIGIGIDSSTTNSADTHERYGHDGSSGSDLQITGLQAKLVHRATGQREYRWLEKAWAGTITVYGYLNTFHTSGINGTIMC